MRSFVLSSLAAAAAGLLLWVAPARACPGQEGTQAQKTAPSFSTQEVVLAGVVKTEGCPVEAQAMNCTGKVLVTTEQGGQVRKFMIVKTEAAEHLLGKVKDKTAVEVTGVTADADGRALVQVKTFKLPGRSS